MLMKKNNVYFYGVRLGRAAYNGGVPCTPNFDSNYNKTLSLCPEPDKQQLFRGWLEGWRSEILDASNW